MRQRYTLLLYVDRRKSNCLAFGFSYHGFSTRPVPFIISSCLNQIFASVSFVLVPIPPSY